MLRYLGHYKHPMIAGVIFVFFTTVFELLAPWILRYAIDFLETFPDVKENQVMAILKNVAEYIDSYSFLSMILLFAGSIILAAVIQGIFRFLMRNTMIGVSRKMEYEIRNDYLAHLQKMETAFYQRHKTVCAGHARG